MPEYEFIAVPKSGSPFPLRVPLSGNCGFNYPTDEAVASAGFIDMGDQSMSLLP